MLVHALDQYEDFCIFTQRVRAAISVDVRISDLRDQRLYA